MEKKKKVGRPVKYVYLDKYERTTKQLEERIDALHESLTKQQTKTQKIQLAIVAILCVSILTSLLF